MRAVQPAMRATFLVLITLYETTGYTHDTFPGDPLIALLEKHRHALQAIERYSAKPTLEKLRGVRESVTQAQDALDAARAGLHAHSPALMNLCISLQAALRDLEQGVLRASPMKAAAQSGPAQTAAVLPAL
jgi:hypothetical protein